jgi:hypothetical protein
MRFRDLIEGSDAYKENIEKGKSIEELHNHVEVVLDLIGYCWFRNDIFMIQLEESYKLQQGGDVFDKEKLKSLMNY